MVGIGGHWCIGEWGRGESGVEWWEMRGLVTVGSGGDL